MLRRSLKGVLLFCVVVGLVAAAGGASAKLKTRHSITGPGNNALFWIGGGLPLPITPFTIPVGTQPPNPTAGRILPTPAATVKQTIGADPKQLTIPAKVLTNPAAPQFTLGVFANNPTLFSVQSNLGFEWPGAFNGPVVFRAGGRTGSPVTTFVSPVPTGLGGIPGLMRYSSTGNQFGGPGQGRVSGTAKVWAIAVSPPPCGPGPTCVAAKIVANPAPQQAAGAPFGFTTSTNPVNQVPGIYAVIATGAGGIAFRTATANSNPGPTNAAKSVGGPWTTGRITISQTAALGTTEAWTVTGSDNRVGGVGTISLVSGALSTRTLSGPNANRGWLHLNIPASAGAVPGLSSWGVAIVALVTLGSAVLMGRRLFATTS